MNYIKILKLIILVAIFFFSVSFIKSDISLKTACAAGWGSSCPNSYGPSYHICPRTGAAYGGCVQSADINVNINGTGIPNGQKFRIEIFPADGSGNTCSDVTCLNRTADYVTTTGWSGSTYSVTLDQIGCSGGACTNNYKVRVTFAQPYVDPTLNCPNPGDVPLTLQNGVPVTANFNIACQQPPQCPTTPPTATINCNNATKTVTCNWNNITGAVDWNADLSKASNLVCRSQWFPGGNGTNGTCTSNTSSRTVTYTNATAGTYTCQVGVFFDPSLNCPQLVSTAKSCDIAPENTPIPTPTNIPTATPPGSTPIPTNTPPPGSTPTPTSVCPKPGTPVVRVTCIGCGGNGSNPTPTPSKGVTPTPSGNTPTPPGGSTPTPTIRVSTPTPTCDPSQNGVNCKVKLP